MSAWSRESEASRYARRRLRRAIAGPAPRGAVVSLVVTVLVAGALLVAGVVRSRDATPPIEDGAAVLTDDGELYLVEDGVAHPLPNVASARLLADQIVSVPSTAVAGLPRGRPLGVRGAPASLPAPGALLDGDWQLCTDDSEDGPRITLTFGAAPYLSPASGEGTLLYDSEQRWVVRDGRRSPAPSQSAHPAIATIPELTGLLPVGSHDEDVQTVTSGGPATVVCVQSDPAAPFARPSAAAIARSRGAADGVLVDGARGQVRVVLPPGAGLLARQPGDEGYWLLTSSGELAPILDEQSLTRLGYPESAAVGVPAELMALLTAGPELSVQAAKDG